MKMNAHAKINWALDITGTRDDGYHLMDMIMQKIDLCDELSFEHADELTLTIEGNETLAQECDNLILKAARALRGDRPLGASIRLKKNIPTGAGLGGGSADAAAALQALNTLWDLNLTDEQLSRIGLKLGADVPYCLTGLPARVRGIGEIITPFHAQNSCELVLLQPDRSLSTKEIFTAYDAVTPVHPDIQAVHSALEKGDLNALRQCSGNVLALPSTAKLPEIEQYTNELYTLGAVYASMTGSGSVVFGVFSDAISADNAYNTLYPSHPVCIRTRTI